MSLRSRKNASEDPRPRSISEQLWRRRFAASSDVLNKALRLNGVLYPIVGVMPGTFRMPMTNESVDVWTPSAFPGSVMGSRETRFYLAVARLRDRVSIDSARAELETIQGRLAAQYPATDLHWTPAIHPLKEVTVGHSRKGLWLLFGAVGLVLLIGCANVACLLLAQAPRRAREMAARFSLGARRAQVIRQLLMEAFLVALPGAILGLIFCGWAIDFLRSIAHEQLPRADEIQLSWPVVLFTLSLSVATTFLFGLVPAWTASREDTAAALRQGARGQVAGKQAILQVLVAGQVALAIVLLIGAGLLLRTMASLGSVPLGFKTRNVLTFRISAAWSEIKDYRGVQHRLEQTLEKLQSVRGVVSAAIVLNPPATGTNYNLEIHIVGRDSRAQGEKLLANAPVVSASYFRTLGIPLLAGNACRDNIDTPNFQQAMINRQFADRYFPNESPIGHTLEAGEGSKTSRVVIAGVVGDARDTSRMQPAGPTIYWCTAPGFWPDPIYLVKTQGPPAAFANTLRQQIKQFEPGRAVYGIAPLEDEISSSVGERRLQTVLLSLFGLTALLLASIGLYGVLGFFVSQRTREIGLRVAIGAAPRQVFRQVFQHGAGMAIGGVAAGVMLGFGLSRLAASLLFGVKQWDPITFVAAPGLLLAVAAFAIGVPSRRATLVDPIEALREE